MSRLIKAQVATLFALLTAMVVTLAACGGGSSSSGFGGSSGGTINGTVNSGTAAILPTGGDRPVFASVLDLVVEPAHAAPISGVVVVLSNSSGTVGTQTTDGSGAFAFTGLPAGDYTLTVAGTDIPVTVGPTGGTQTVEITSGGGTLMVQVNTDATSVSGSVGDGSCDGSSDGESDGSSDGLSDDDCSDDASSDADSLDDASSDADSVDDVSSDDASDDDSSDEDGGTA